MTDDDISLKNGSSEQLSTTSSSDSLVAGRYRLVERLGTGAAGVVWKAVDKEHGGHHVAMKVLAPVDFKDPTAKARFEKEVALTREFQHPNVVKVYDYGMTETGQQYLTMEFVEGGTLAGRIYDYENELTFEHTLFQLRDVALGVGYAHSHGIVHRDLKPDNILIAAEGTAKVADFGLARRIASGATITRSAETVGTPYYMAPEQFKNHRVDGRADIYSLGIIAFEMVNRRRPFVNDTFEMIALAHMRNPMPSFYQKGGEIPKWFETFVFTCTEKNRDSRFASMEEVVKYLEDQLRKMGSLEGEVRQESRWLRLVSKLLGED